MALGRRLNTPTNSPELRRTGASDLNALANWGLSHWSRNYNVSCHQ